MFDHILLESHSKKNYHSIVWIPYSKLKYSHSSFNILILLNCYIQHQHLHLQCTHLTSKYQFQSRIFLWGRHQFQALPLTMAVSCVHWLDYILYYMCYIILYVRVSIGVYVYVCMYACAVYMYICICGHICVYMDIYL